MQAQTTFEDNSDIERSKHWLESSSAQAAFGQKVAEAQRLAGEQHAAHEQLIALLDAVLSTGKADFVTLGEALLRLDAAADAVRQANVSALHGFVWYAQELAGERAGQFIGSQSPFDTSGLPEALPARLALRRWALADGEAGRVIRLGLAQALAGVEARLILAARPVEYARRVSIYG